MRAPRREADARDHRGLLELVSATRQVRDLGGIGRERDCFAVRRARLVSAAQAAQQIGARRMVGVIAGQLALEAVDDCQRPRRASTTASVFRPVWAYAQARYIADTAYSGSAAFACSNGATDSLTCPGRLFGQPPRRDAERMRELPPVRA